MVMPSDKICAPIPKETQSNSQNNKLNSEYHQSTLGAFKIIIWK